MKKNLLLSMVITALLFTACGTNQAEREVTPPETAGQAVTEIENTETAETEANTAQTESQDTDTANTEETVAKEPLDDASIGPVVFTPNGNDFGFLYGTDMLDAYFKRPGVIPGKGKLRVHKVSDDSVVEEIDLSDVTNCEIAEPDTTFDMMGWEEGTHLSIYMDTLLESGESYYVTLEEGAFTSQDKKISSKAATDNTFWQLNVTSYGLILDDFGTTDVLVGDVLYADVLIRHPAAYAKIENYDENRIRFNDKEFTKDGRLEIKIYQIGEDSFTINFYDEGDALLGSSTLSFLAEIPPEPASDAPPKKPVTNL